jgi:hypothetical protein
MRGKYEIKSKGGKAKILRMEVKLNGHYYRPAFVAFAENSLHEKYFSIENQFLPAHPSISSPSSSSSSSFFIIMLTTLNY